MKMTLLTPLSKMQTQQGHFHPRPFWLGLMMMIKMMMMIIVIDVITVLGTKKDRI